MEGKLNTSGIEPFGTNCLVRMKKLESKTASGIVVCTENELERRQMAQTIGLLVAKGADAHFDIKDPPQVGQAVFVKKYSGLHVEGADGHAYRLCVDVEIVATVSEPEKLGGII